MPERQTLEEALERLEVITRSLEGGDIELDESLSLYEEGIRLIRFAEEAILAAELRIGRLHGDGTVARMKSSEAGS